MSRARMTMDFLPGAHPKTRELLVSASPICDGKTLAVLVVEDVTLNAKLEQALRRSEKLAVTGRLTTAIVHEINNPLQALENFLHLLGAEPALSDSSVELVELAKREVARLVSISRQTLVPHREAKLPVCTRASEVLDEVIAVFDRRLESARIEVRREYQTDGEVVIYPGELRQVFTNLVANAIDAIGHGGEIHLSIQESPRDGVIVRVCDNGCGIPPEHFDAIFEPFFTTKGEKGTGIGLWVIRGILANAGGKIEVQSSTTGNPGTCFSVYLPTEA